VPRHRLSPILGIIAGAALILAFPAFTALLTDWWWFQEVGYEVVFTRELLTRSLLFLVVGAVTSGALYLNLRIAQRGLVPYPVIVNAGPSVPALDLTRSLRRLSLPFSLVLGLLVGLGARIGSGCTSGHGVCGVGRLAPRSIVASAVFVSAAMLTVYVVRHLLGGI